MYESDTGWRITQLIDTSRREDCFHPPGREPKTAEGTEPRS